MSTYRLKKKTNASGATETIKIPVSDVEGALGEIAVVAGPNIAAVGTPSVSVETEGATSTLSFNYLKGETGATGPAGPAGSMWYAIGVTPPAGLGKEYDLCLLTSTGEFFVKNATQWVSRGSLKGPQGDPGVDAHVTQNGVTKTNLDFTLSGTTLTITQS